jgi:hypothetical protein
VPYAGKFATVTAQEFSTSVDRLLRQVGHWEQARWWSRPPSAAGIAPTRADTLYALIQRLADLGADAENRPHHPVPRLSDLVLRDQLRVMADDLLAAGSGHALAQATDDITAVRRAL